MRKERILAVIMSVLLALSMIPATVFAAEIPALDGKLKIQGTAAEGRTLSAEFKEVKPEGVTEEDVAYLWERKTVEDEETEKAGEKPELKELGKDKIYTVTQCLISTRHSTLSHQTNSACRTNRKTSATNMASNTTNIPNLRKTSSTRRIFCT